MDDYKNKVQNKYENTNLFEEQQELYDYLTKKKSRTLNKLDKVIEYNEQTKNKDLTYNIFNTIVFNMYTNCRDVMIDLSKKKKRFFSLSSSSSSLDQYVVLLCMHNYLKYRNK